MAYCGVENGESDVIILVGSNIPWDISNTLECNHHTVSGQGDLNGLIVVSLIFQDDLRFVGVNVEVPI